MLNKYLENIAQITAQGDQREESYYHILANLINDFAGSINRDNISVTILPKKTEAGNPDFRVWDGFNRIVGYIEAKVPGTDLSRTEGTEQLRRYLETFPNVILTNFYDFRLYRNGEFVAQVSIGREFIAEKLHTIPPVENIDEFIKLFERFFDFSLPKIYSSENLAVELAKRTRFLRDEIISIELQNTDSKNYIRGFYNAFRQYLINDLEENDFADLYAQTITYGLFAAKTRAKHEAIFNRRSAIEYIPQTVGILRDIFEYISLGKLAQQMEVIVDDIAEVLSVADAKKLLDDYYEQAKGDDPIIHFYETFLNRYDPETREKRGVYYTPEPIVKYIVNSVDEILRKDFNKNGFADSSIKVLDPASGTMTFLAEATKKAINTFVNNFGEGGKTGFIKNHILKNYFGFELLMAPYAIAHLKISYLLQEQGYNLADDDRFQLYLTNTLDAKVVDMPELPGLSSLAEEATEANKIRKDTPILAIIGNPPYSITSYNKSEFETNLMKLYKEDVKKEKNIQILSDDYIKFIRYCHWKIEESGEGVVGLITKNTYLNIAAAKGLRKQLLLSFDRIYILNLHGKLYEKTPNGEKDQSVFNIRVGTAIIFLVKLKSKKKKTYAKLFYKDLYGDREDKYNFLNFNDLNSTFSENEELEIDENHFFFEKKNFSNNELYDKFWAIDEILLQKSSGVKTHRDHFIIANKKTELESRLNAFLNSKLPEELLKKTFGISDNRDFKVSKLKLYFKEIDKAKFQDLAFKPFIKKIIYYDKNFIDFDRSKIMKNFINHDNFGLVIKKRYYDRVYKYCMVTNKITDVNFLGGQSYIFPLWIYKQNGDAFNGNGHYKNQVSNFNPKFEELLEETYSQKNITERIFYYIYAVLHSNTYRNNFKELLKIDFPKIPFTANYELFNKIAELGKELTELHLLISPKINEPKVKFQGKGNSKIDDLQYDTNKQVIYINETQYFENINQELWDYEIGKIRVVQHWFKDRLLIEFEDAVEFCKIATAIYQTFELQKQIDEIFPDILVDYLTKY